ncbi:ribulose-phosphate 3-epimerase [Patescibacteria group bacterium]
MSNNITIIPAILESNLETLKEKLKLAESFTKKVQIDIADGQFVDNRTLTDFSWLADFDTSLEIEFHLMVADPRSYINNLPLQVTSVSAHIETIADPVIFAELVRAQGKQVGFAVNPDTPLEEIEKFVEIGDFFQFLTVIPGFQGSDFRSDVLEKIKNIHKKYPDVVLQADGGITPETAPHLAAAGVMNLVSGSFIFGHNKPSEAYQELSDSVL